MRLWSGKSWVGAHERAALDAEIGRLQADNEKLKAQLAAREPTVTGKIEEALPKSDSLKKGEPKVADHRCPPSRARRDRSESGRRRRIERAGCAG